MTLLEFARQCTMPRTLGAEPTRRSKRVIVIARPYCPPDPTGPKYEQYCRQSLMQHSQDDSTQVCIYTYIHTHIGTHMLLSLHIHLLADGVVYTNTIKLIYFSLSQEHNEEQTIPSRSTDQWVCHHNAGLELGADSKPDINWTQAANIFTTSADPLKLQGKQLQVYTAVREHAEAANPPPLLCPEQPVRGSHTSSSSSGCF